MKTCKTCSKELYPRNTSGYCRKCKNSSPEHRSSVSAKMKLRWNFDPEARKNMTEAGIRNLSAPGVREKAIAAAKANKTWEIASKHITKEGRERGGKRCRETKLSHIPREYWDQYRHLTRGKGYRAEEASKLIADQHRIDMGKFVKKIMEY